MRTQRRTWTPGRGLFGCATSAPTTSMWSAGCNNSRTPRAMVPSPIRATRMPRQAYRAAIVHTQNVRTYAQPSSTFRQYVLRHPLVSIYSRPHMLRLLGLLPILAVLFLAPGAPVLAAQGPSLAALRTSGGAEVSGVYVRLPSTNPSGPLKVLVALHGMGGNGADFGSALAAQADANGWVIVAPTISYGDWTNPDVITREDPALVAWLSDYVTTLSQRTGVPTESKVLLFGHSRGAQLALRFTEIHPEQVEG